MGGRYGHIISSRSLRPSTHFGIDMHALTGTKLISVDKVVVKYTGWTIGKGIAVMIDHRNGCESHYLHCDNVFVEVGEYVPRGHHIANVGKTGGTLTEHLHFEIWLDGVCVDPMRFYGVNL